MERVFLSSGLPSTAAHRTTCTFRVALAVVHAASPCWQQDLKKGGASIDLHRPLTLEERQRIVSEAMGTDLEDAEDLLRRQRARYDACVPLFRRSVSASRLPTGCLLARVFIDSVRSLSYLTQSRPSSGPCWWCLPQVVCFVCLRISRLQCT